MLNPWFSFGLASARRGLEAQSAFVSSLLRLLSGVRRNCLGRLITPSGLVARYPNPNPRPR
jgi:hypothetical protein